MLSIKQVTKSSRSLLFPLLLFNFKNNSTSLISPTCSTSSSSSSSTTTSLYCCFYYDYSTAAAAAANTRDRGLIAKNVASSIKEWFEQGRNELLDRIFLTIRKHGEDKDTLGFALSQLRLPLNEKFVLDVLAYGNARKEIYSCVKFFDWAGHKGGFFHTRATFHAFFKILSKSEGMSVMLDFLDSYSETRDLYFHHNVRFYTVLVMGYAVAGKTDDALQLFGRMRFQGLDLDAFSYHVLLNSLIQHNSLEAFEVIFKQISLRGFENAVTRFLKVKYLCQQKLLDEAEAYFRKLVSEGKGNKDRSGERFGYAQALRVLVDGFCQNGLYVKASGLIEEISKLELVAMEPAYGIWLKNLVHAGEIDAASEFLKSKNSLEGYVPDIFRCNFLLSRLLKDNRLGDACDLLIEMKENQLSTDTVTMNAALCFFCKAGMVEVAYELYKSNLLLGFSPNSLAYNYLINSLCGEGSSDEAYSLLKNSIRQGVSLLDMMMDLVLLALSKNHTLGDSTYNKFMSTLCRAGRVEDAYVMLGEFNRRNRAATEATYRLLIYGFNKSNRGDMAARLLLEMQDKGHQPTRKLFRAVICCLCDMKNPEMYFFKLLEMQLSCHESDANVYNFFIDGAGHSKKPELAREVFEIMQRNGIEANICSHIFLLKAYLRNERISEALNFFKATPDSKMGKKLYSAMVVGLCGVKRTSLALDFLKEMRNKGMVPGMECYDAIVQLLCSTKNYDVVINIINDLKKCRHRLTSFIGNVLLLHSLKSKELYEAWVRSRDVQNGTSSDLSNLGLLIGAFSGHFEVSLEYLEEVIEQYFSRDIYTYNLLLRMLAKRDLDHALELFYRLCDRGYEPNRWTFDIMAHGHFKHGRKVQGMLWVEEMWKKGFDPTEGTLRFLSR
ncbi:unnamed protein product [Dovyalis caffra]|uniref:Pentatricopeptide repeat-containing protein n=1 Tax=Dovyalis caffra TaxID=77055 RepID=A0AAV1SVG2_9ROSI|nr:unnamed protein product [Dovyalis caffra]